MKKIVYWIPAIIIMIIIFYLSMDGSSASDYKSNGVADFIINIFNLKKIDPFYLNVLIRKIAHFGIYFVLGFFVIFALSKTTKLNIFNIFIISLLICFLYACTDELHQLLVTGRSGEIKDVILDSSGSSIMILIYYFYLKLFVNKINYDKMKLK